MNNGYNEVSDVCNEDEALFKSHFIHECSNDDCKGISKYLVANYSNKFRSYENKFYYFDKEESSWKLDKNNMITEVFREIIKDFLNEADRLDNSTDVNDMMLNKTEKMSKKLREISTKLDKSHYRDEVIKWATAGKKSLIYTGDFDQLKDCIPFTNGIYDFNTNEFRETKPEDNVLTTTNVPYDPSADCPKFRNAMIESLNGDIEVYNYLMTSMGSALIKDNRNEKFFILYGKKGRNGKGLFTQSIRDAIGRLSYNIPANSLLEQKVNSAGQARCDLIKLKNKCVCFVNELPSTSKSFDGEFIKNVTGGDTISARGLYKDMEEFKPTFTMFMSTNTLPQAPRGEGSEAFWRRIRIIPFPVTFVENPDQSNIFEKQIDESLKKYIIENELSGIMNEIIKYAKKYIENDRKFEPLGKIPNAIKNATKQYRTDNDFLLQFVEERMIKDIAINNQKILYVYQEYLNWIRDNNIEKPMSLKAFSKELSSYITLQKRGNGNVIVGWRLKTDEDIINEKKSVATLTQNNLEAVVDMI